MTMSSGNFARFFWNIFFRNITIVLWDQSVSVPNKCAQKHVFFWSTNSSWIAFIFGQHSANFHLHQLRCALTNITKLRCAAWPVETRLYGINFFEGGSIKNYDIKLKKLKRTIINNYVEFSSRILIYINLLQVGQCENRLHCFKCSSLIK